MRWISLMLLFIATLIVYADQIVIGFAAEPLMKEFSLNASQWGMVGSSFFILYIITSLIGGTWSDRIGTTRMLFVVLAGVSIIQFGSIAIVGFSMLITYRILLGALEGPFYPSGLSHISQIFPENLRGLAMSVMIAGGSIGGVVCAPILVSLIENIGWRWTFVSLGFVSLTVLMIWALVNRYEKNNQKDRRTQAPKLKWKDIAPVLRNPACFLTIALSASSYWLITWMALWAPVYLTKVVKLAPMQMAFAISGTGIASIVLVLLISFFSDYVFKKTKSYRKARVWVAGISSLIGGLALASIPLVGNLFLWIVVALCVAKGFNFVNISMSAQIMIRLMPERAGFMTSILSLGNNVSQLIAPLVTGLLVQAAGANLALGFHYSIYVMVGLFVTIAIFTLLLVKPDNLKEHATSETIAM
ncbi:MFS transporter [Bacillus sp. JJ722]|uniref:MFS transporter n=1 Tax=Bacillus sp. JJ722 TaxID=3122973 RepID=UPI002FFE3AD3